MPCCLLLALFFLGPRLVIIGLAVFTAFFERAYDGLLIPILGFLFLPFTTIAYAWAINTRGAVEGLQLAVVVIAVLFDLGVLGGGASKSKEARSSS